MKHSINVVFAIIIIYGMLYLFSFWATPLGQTAVLDGAENIRLASQIYNGNLPHEPFFRSMLYPALLSLFYYFGANQPDTIFTIASLLGIISHFISSFLVFLCSKNLWQSQKTAIIAAFIYGLYPTAVFFAAEPLDTTISITFMLGSILCFLKALDTNSTKTFISSGILLGISCLLRSNLLPIAIIYLVYPFFDKNKTKPCLTATMSLAFIMFLNGFACYLHSGQFKVLPWQGASNFYSANSHQANGKYYRQTILLPDREQGTNPARKEAELIYAKVTGENLPFNLNKFNKFWLTKAFQEITDSPGNWLTLMQKKVYFLFNNYEQYNNKTFSFHKENSFILKYNPICYGLVVIIFFISLSDILINNPKCTPKYYCLLTALFFMGLGIIAFYVSARFRLPIVSLLIILEVGIFQNKLASIIKPQNIIIAALCSILTFTGLFGANDTSTWKEDKLLNAFACARLGYDLEQIYWTNQVLKDEPTNVQAIRLKIVGFTNLVLSGIETKNLDWQSVTKELDYMIEKNLYYDDCLLLLGCYQYKIKNNKEKAFEIWKKGMKSQSDLFAVCLIYTGFISSNNFLNINDKVLIQNPFLIPALKKHGIIINNAMDSDTINNPLQFLLEK